MQKQSLEVNVFDKDSKQELSQEIYSQKFHIHASLVIWCNFILCVAVSKQLYSYKTIC